ncbi:MAG: Uma2 family endonuclease [Lewinellaceae bacterium]|nr:Uma2 family endonuclease [Lewinellaceae bacterium]
MKAHKLPKLTVEEYIQQERESGARYEYHDGTIYALAGGTLNHGKLCGNIYAELRNNLKAKTSNCKAYTGEIKLYIEKKNSYVYPDSMVICGEIETSKEDENSVTNPLLIVEVLSKSTSDYDRGDKFYIYRQIPTLQEYVLIEQDKPVVEIYYKKENTDLWSITRQEGLDKRIEFQSLKIDISMADLYYDIESLDA